MNKHPGLNHKSGPGAAHWKGGRSKHFLGYMNLRIDGKDVLEHRYVMEQYIGRKLSSDELVHHKNDDKTDNRLQNLELLSRSEHMRIHATERYLKNPQILRGTIKCGAMRKGKSPSTGLNKTCRRRSPCSYHGTTVAPPENL